MEPGITLTELLTYTDWQRDKWQARLHQLGDAVLQTKCGEHGDGRMETVGDNVRHIFSAEKRYVDRLTERELTDTNTVPADRIDSLFDFGRQSRAELRTFIASLPADRWDAMLEWHAFGKILRATPRKIVLHVLMHEIRHWAQIATVLRLNGMPGDWQDFLFSPALGGEIVDEKTASA